MLERDGENFEFKQKLENLRMSKNVWTKNLMKIFLVLWKMFFDFWMSQVFSAYPMNEKAYICLSSLMRHSTFSLLFEFMFAIRIQIPRCYFFLVIFSNNIYMSKFLSKIERFEIGINPFGSLLFSYNFILSLDCKICFFIGGIGQYCLGRWVVFIVHFLHQIICKYWLLQNDWFHFHWVGILHCHKHIFSCLPFLSLFPRRIKVIALK